MFYLLSKCSVALKKKSHELNDALLQHTLPPPAEVNCFSGDRTKITHIDFHLAIEPIIQQQIVSHADTMWFHWMTLAIVVIPNVTYVCTYISITKINREIVHSKKMLTIEPSRIVLGRIVLDWI